MMLVAGVPAARAVLLAVLVPALVSLGLTATQFGRRVSWLRAAVGMLLGSLLSVVVVVTLLTGPARLLSEPA